MAEAYCINSNGNIIKYFTQWDVNQKIIIQLGNVDLSIPPEIHFSNKNSTKALVVKTEVSSNKIIADVPNTLLTEPESIVAHVYLTDSTDTESKKSIARIIIPVRKRVQPEGYVYTDNVEILSYYELKNELIELEELISKGITIIQATENDIGGIKAVPKDETYTIEVKIGDDGKLYVPQNLSDIIVDSELSESSTNPIQNKVIAIRLSNIEENIESSLKEKLDKNLGADSASKNIVTDGDGNIVVEPKETIPSSLPNPYKLIFTGAANEEYDGASEKTICIPSSLPPVDSSDNGKFLQVVNGEWTSVLVENGNEVGY